MYAQARNRFRDRPRMTRRDDSLISQVVAANVLLVALTLLAASLVAGLDLQVPSERWQFLVLALAIILTLCVNMWMLQRRFRPLERLIERVEQVDPAAPGTIDLISAHKPAEEISRLAESFRRLLERIEQERRRLARDLHDEVNQALTAILLRLEALAQEAPAGQAPEVAELKRLVNQAMDELLNLARQLRPSALDDHGLVPAIDAQLKRFAARTGVEARLHAEGDLDALEEDVQTAIYRVAQEALTNAERHAGSTVVEVDLEASDARTQLRVRDDGNGFDPGRPGRSSSQDPAASGLGLRGMAERARLVGGELDVRSAPGGGTSVTLRIR